MSILDETTGWSPAVFAARDRPDSVVMHTEHGHAVEVDAARWHGAADAADLRLLERLTAPVLDIGTGPGRMLAALTACGIDAAGIDVCPEAVAAASRNGAAVVLGDVFDHVPSAGLWEGALLLDGNIGIGGDPVRLLRRVAELVTGRGLLVVEVAAPTEVATGRRVRLTHPDGDTGWFPWAVVGVNEIPTYAEDAGWDVRETWQDCGRWFVCLARTPEATT